MKRVLDIVGALTGVVLLSPVLAAVWFVIVMESGLPGFFRQRRMGRGGSEFTLYKFRSMTVQREHQAPIQIDGELVEAPTEIEVGVLPGALKVLVPKKR